MINRIKYLHYIKMDFNPMMAPPPAAAPMPGAAAKSGGGKTTLYIVIFFLCVISVMAGAFYFQMQSAASASEDKLKTLKSDFEKSQIQAAADEKTRSAELRAKVQAREEQLKKLEAKVNADLQAAAKAVKDANNLKKAAQDTAADAAKRLEEAEAAQKKAEATGEENDKKLAAEKKRLADEAAAKVAAANKRADEEAAKAKAEAKKATALKKNLDKANAKMAGREYERASPYGAVPGYKIPGRKAVGIKNRKNVSNPAECKKLARKEGANVWGHRGLEHPNAGWKNSCFFYSTSSRNKYAGDKNDKIHMIGCTYGGNPKTGCKANPFNKVYSKDTPDNYDGSRTRIRSRRYRSIYLDRHKVDCGKDGILGFQLRRPSKSKIDYKYACLDGINSNPGPYKYTKTNDWGGGNTIYLDRHDVNCGSYPITDFKLQRPSNTTIRYEYRCSSKKAGGKCRNLNSGWNKESRYNIYLDRHKVSCDKHEALTRFRLRRDGKGKFRYDYKCCAM
jgi:hypothetical protein